MKWLIGAAGVLCVACGAPASGDLLTLREPIMGGYVDDETTGAVSVGMNVDNHYFFGYCSGTLIAPNLVLTARHCVADTSNTGDRGVVCGVSEFTTEPDASMFWVSPATESPVDPADPSLYRASSVRRVPGANEMCGFDVALVILEGAGIPADKATPIVPRIDLAPMPGEEFSAVGFGITEPLGTQSGTRMRLDANTVRCTGVECRSIIVDVRSTEWLSLDALVCSGDSGGPALDDQGRVTGVTSRGPDDCGGTIFGNVFSWRDFIIETGLEAAQLGGYDAPFWTTGTSTRPPPKLGEACESECAQSLQCYSETDAGSGICVPPCDSDEDCPNGYGCADSPALCMPEGSRALRDDSKESGCATTPARPRNGGWIGVAALLSVMALASRRRRCVDPARKRAGEIDEAS